MSKPKKLHERGAAVITRNPTVHHRGQCCRAFRPVRLETTKRSRERAGQQIVDAKYRTPLAQVRHVQLLAIELDELPDVSLLYC